MKIMITGSSGFIGKALFRHLQDQGHEVYGTTHTKPAGPYRTACDINEKCFGATLPAERFDVVINTIGSNNLSSQELHNINARGSRKVANWALAHGCQHFIQLSSTAVYGYSSNNEFCAEERGRCLIGNAYMRSKARGERHIEKSGLDYTILRLPGVLGGEENQLTRKLVNGLLAGQLTFSAKKSRMISTISLNNLMLIIDKLIEKGPLGGAFNCSDHTTTWEHLVREYAQVLGVPLDDKHRSLRSRLPEIRKSKLAGLEYCGAHYPHDKLEAHLGQLPIKESWQSAVRGAIEKQLEGKAYRINPEPQSNVTELQRFRQRRSA